MATHPTRSIINDWRRPSGGLGATVGDIEIDWEPGDLPIPLQPELGPYWQAIQRHMAHPRPPVD